MALKLLLLAAAGGLGTLARFGTGALAERLWGNAFPWGTLAVNMLGCLLFGVTVSLFERTGEFGADVRVLLLTGFMGAFTTYSTFAYQTAELMRESQWLPAAANLIAQNAGGILLVFAGLWLGRLGQGA